MRGELNMAADNRLLVAGLVLFGSAVIARKYPSDGIGISPDDLPEEEEVFRSKWVSKRAREGTRENVEVNRAAWTPPPRTETIVVSGRRGSTSRSPITKTMFDKEPELPLEEQRRLANERGQALVEQAKKNEIVLSPTGVKIVLPAPSYEVYGDPLSIIEKYIKRAEESQKGKPDDYLVPTPEERRILTLNQNRRNESMKARIEAGEKRAKISSEAIKESCLNRVPQMVRIRKLLDRPELLEPALASELKARWVKFQAQCIENIPTVMNRYLHFNPR